MGVFDKVDQSDFDKFKQQVRSELQQLKVQIQEKTTDSEADAKQAAENAQSALSNIEASEARVKAHLETLDKLTQLAQTHVDNFESQTAQLTTKTQELDAKLADTKQIFDQASESRNSIEASSNEVTANIATITSALHKSKELPAAVDEVTSLIELCKQLHQDIEQLKTHSMKKKSEIDSLHKEIHGEDVEDQEGNTEHTDGLIDELEKSYSNISTKLNDLRSEIETSLESIESEHKLNLTGIRNDYAQMLRNSRKSIRSVSDKLTGLLPGAMAEGLSAAYEQKKQDEIARQGELEKNFSNAIISLVVISLIPFGIDVYLIWQGDALVDVLQKTPNLLASILPLYFPILWLAYSSNKKLNLSKRLIEEYTHKAVLGKTFDGLSNQIESLPKDSPVRDDLRTRLLFNLLQVSSENPGKLITDYDKSDHPLMEALENSSKLANSMEALSKLPGFAPLANKLAKKSDAILNQEAEKISQGLETQELLEGDKTESRKPNPSPAEVTA